MSHTAGELHRVFTLLDVVASTSLQAGLLISGFLITVSANAETSLTDPYRAFVLITTATTVPAIIWFKKASAQSDAFVDAHPS